MMQWIMRSQNILRNCNTVKGGTSSWKNLKLNFIEENDFTYSLEVEQLRALFTAFCFHQNIDTDTSIFDRCVAAMWSKIQEKPWSERSLMGGKKQKDTFDMYIGALLC